MYGLSKILMCTLELRHKQAIEHSEESVNNDPLYKIAIFRTILKMHNASWLHLDYVDIEASKFNFKISHTLNRPDRVA